MARQLQAPTQAGEANEISESPPAPGAGRAADQMRRSGNRHSPSRLAHARTPENDIPAARAEPLCLARRRTR